MKRENWYAAIEKATSKPDNGHPSKREILAIAKEMFPSEIAAEYQSVFDRGLMRELSDAMRSAANTGEDDEASSSKPALQLDLPGMPPPHYLQVPVNGELSIVRYDRAVKPDLIFTVDYRHKIAARITARALDLNEKNQFLFQFMDSDTITVAEALRKSRGEAA
jgi:hypothetical protein